MVLPEVTVDIDSVVRSTTTPDMGCVEFTPGQNDAGIVSIDGPITPIGAGNYTVSATLKNYGLLI